VAQARPSGGAGSAAADKYQALISALLWSTHPDLAHKIFAKLTKLVPLLLSTLRDGLETVQYPATKTSAFLEALMGLHQAAFRAVHKEATAAAVKVEAAAAKAAAATPRAGRNRPCGGRKPVGGAFGSTKTRTFWTFRTRRPPRRRRLRPFWRPRGCHRWSSGPEAGGLPLGSWVELHTNGEWVRTQLTWASPHGTLFLFTSAAGSTQSTDTPNPRQTGGGGGSAGARFSAQPVVDGALDAVAQQAMKNSVDSTL